MTVLGWWHLSSSRLTILICGHELLFQKRKQLALTITHAMQVTEAMVQMDHFLGRVSQCCSRSAGRQASRLVF